MTPDEAAEATDRKNNLIYAGMMVRSGDAGGRGGGRQQHYRQRA